MTWQELERFVRKMAELKFGKPARAEDIAGIRCDCVIDLGDGSVAIIEISKEKTIEKLRTDLAKFNVLRPHFFSKNILPRCYFITQDSPTPSLIASGKSNYVEVFSVIQFIDAFFGIKRYATSRNKLSFGSAVDLYSGEPDRNNFIEVLYTSNDGGNYSISDISNALLNGKTIVLLGDYGSGKSRCIQEIFGNLIDRQNSRYCFPVAINLRENWGLKRAEEIITRHYTELQLGDILEQAARVAYSPATIYLLDGFDEIGAQTWSDDPAKLVDIRKQSLVGIKDLIGKSRGGVLIAGREHYFNNDVELIECLGLARRNPLFIQCSPQLTDEQFGEFLGRPATALPNWMPKKPLIATIIRDMDPAILDQFLQTSSGEIDFWNLLIDTFCERESRINSILDPHIIRLLYTKIGRIARSTPTPLGPIPITKINAAFESVTGRPPTDESAIVLQRLPGLSRIGAESLDRQFADKFILDGLKAEDAIGLLSQGDSEVINEIWRHPVEEFGSYFIGSQLSSTGSIGAAVSYIGRNKRCANKILLSDFISGLLQLEDTIDLSNYKIKEGSFYIVSLANTGVINLQFEDCHFNYLDITDAEPIGIALSECTISRLDGVTSSDHTPNWLKDCLVENYQSVQTLVAIREAGLSFSQTFLLSSLRKLFLQPGGGRKESSMYKGYGDSTAKKTCDKIIHLLIREKFCAKYKGATESLYVPDRALTNRAKTILNQMTTSKDPIWEQASRIK